MPLIIRVPRNETVLRRSGPYVSALNVLDRKKTAVQRQLRRGGLASYEAQTQATLLALAEVAPRPTVFLDVGAHIGLYAALVAAVCPEGSVEVCAFEPTPETAAIARRLAKANGLSVRVEELALSSSPGTAQLFVSSKAETSNSMARGFRKSTETVDVQVTTIDDYCRTRKIRPSFLKIDVETLEAQVLLGGLDTFNSARPAIVCEILPASDHDVQDGVLARLRDMGYVFYHVGEDGRWSAVSLEQYRRHVSNDHRDWLLVHGRLPAGLTRAISRWLEAIAVCTERTNDLVDAGTPLEEGWNAPYPSRTPTWRDRLADGVWSIGEMGRRA